MSSSNCTRYPWRIIFIIWNWRIYTCVI